MKHTRTAKQNELHNAPHTAPQNAKSLLGLRALIGGGRNLELTALGFMGLMALMGVGSEEVKGQSANVYKMVCQPKSFESEDWFSVHADGTFFFQNDEYFTPHVEGYTLVGYMVRPSVSYDVVPDELDLTAGFQALGYAGLDKMHYVRPVVAVRWTPLPYLALQMGTLRGPDSHWHHDALQDCEEQITSKPEFGAQVDLETKAWDATVWLNWRQFIFLGDTIPEKFTAGIRAEFHPGFDVESPLGFSMPITLTFDHIGGQISNYPDTMQSLANVGLSPTLHYMRDGRFVKMLSLSVHTMLFHTMTGSGVRPFDDGWAVSPEVRMKAKYLNAEVGYWHSQNFFALHGSPMYWSTSNYDATVYEKERDLITMGAAFVKNISYVGAFELKARGFYDIGLGQFDYSYGMSLVLSLHHD